MGVKIDPSLASDGDPNIEPPSDSPHTVTLADVEPEQVDWLWPGRLPIGKLVMLDGDPNIGKSTLAVDWAARVSTGTDWPDAAACRSGDVVVLSAEDGLADTIRPRVDAAGGDPSRIHALTAIITYRDEDDMPHLRPVTLADVVPIGEAINRHRAVLVLVDVLMAYLPGGVDSHRDQDVRAVLARIAGTAEDTHCCVVLLRHMNKTVGRNPLYRGGGSIGIVGAARAGFVAAPDPDDDTRSILAATKSNLAPMPPSLAYRLTGTDNGAARVEWGGHVPITAASLLADHDDDDAPSQRDAMGQWLTDLLADGPVDARDVYRAADAAGYSKDQAKRAKKRLGVLAEREGFGKDGVWRWRLPPDIEGTKGGEGSRDMGPTPLHRLDAPLDARLPADLDLDAAQVATFDSLGATEIDTVIDTDNDRGDSL